MKISLRQQGGLLGLDREVEVDGDVVKIIDKGDVRYAPRLDPAQREQVERLAARVAEVSDKVIPLGGDLPSDAMATDIAIEDGGRRSRLAVTSGDSAPDEVWELIGVLGAVSDAD